MKRIGVMGGTFDPPHFGHLAAAEESRYRLGLNKVLWVPNGMPPHKTDNVVSEVGDRVQMTQLAIQGNPSFEISTLEVERDGPSYTVETLQELTDSLPGYEVVFLMGSDEFMDLGSWYAPGLLPQLARLGVMVRGGIEVDVRRTEIEVPEVCGRYDLVCVPDIPISSSDLRNRVRQGIPIRYLMPEPVREYIETHRLYVE